MPASPPPVSLPVPSKSMTPASTVNSSAPFSHLVESPAQALTPFFKPTAPVDPQLHVRLKSLEKQIAMLKAQLDATSVVAQKYRQVARGAEAARARADAAIAARDTELRLAQDELRVLREQLADARRDPESAKTGAGGSRAHARDGEDREAEPRPGVLAVLRAQLGDAQRETEMHRTNWEAVRKEAEVWRSRYQEAEKKLADRVSDGMLEPSRIDARLEELRRELEFEK